MCLKSTRMYAVVSRFTVLMDYVRSLEFRISRKRNVSGTGSVSETLCFLVTYNSRQRT
jgi:hypothetical protein